jgi:DNA-binding GntR family transcriptional regulator
MRKSTSHEAYKAIKDLILNNQLFPGQKIIYRDLEEKLKMSKTPIINALVMLEKDHLVVSQKNRGFYIRGVNRKEAEQIYELRQRLEEIAIGYAIENHGKKDLDILREKLDSYNAYVSDIYDQKRLALDTAFHLQIVVMGKNPFLTKIMEQFYENIYFVLRVIFLSPYVERFKKDHDLLFHAIEGKNIEEAKRVLKLHMESCRDLVVKLANI